MKTCTVCAAELALEAFSLDRTSKDGHCTRCKACCNANSKKRYEANRDRIKAAVAVYTAANAEKVTEYKRAHYLKNRSALVEQHAAYYRSNAATIKSRTKAWRQKNPGRYALNQRAVQATRRARMRQAEGQHSAADIERILRLQRWRCAECRKGIRKSYHVDHIAALATGGSNWSSNLQCLCPPCNQSKGAKDPIAFAQRNGRLL